jgi:hypothetical protein
MNALTPISHVIPLQTNRPEPAALAFAAALDRTYTAGADPMTEDRLYQVAELMGGLGVSFVTTLTDHLDAAEADLIDACAGQRGCGFRGPPPNSWELATVRAAAAWTWLNEARAIMDGIAP